MAEDTRTPEDASKPEGLVKEICYWTFFSVVVSLAQLWLVPVAYYLVRKPWTVVGLVGNGSLLFFATTITAKTAGEYFKKVKGHHEWAATLGCSVMTFLTVILSAFILGLESAARAGVMAADTLSPERVTVLSVGLAVSGLIFSLGYTLLMRKMGESH